MTRERLECCARKREDEWARRGISANHKSHQQPQKRHFGSDKQREHGR